MRRGKEKKELEAGRRSVSVDLEVLANLITLLDGYRVNYFVDLKWADKVISDGKTGLKVKSEWKDFRKTLVKMAALPKSLSHVSKLWRIQQYTLFLGTIFSTIIMIIFAITIFAYRTIAQTQYHSLIIYISIPAFCIMFGAFIAKPLLGYMISKEIDKYCEAHPEKFGVLRIKVKKFVQYLIDLYSAYLKRFKENPERRAIQLYNVDYRGIKVVKRAGRIRKHHTAVVKIS